MNDATTLRLRARPWQLVRQTMGGPVAMMDKIRDLMERSRARKLQPWFVEAFFTAALQQYDRTWWREYKTMYRFLRWLQKWGYGNERQMEVFTDMCRNKDVQQLTFESYMFKRMTPVPWLSQMRMTGDILAAQVRHYLPYAGARA